ncbi:hypothetical protein V8F33_008600 [Rhypophila sp. PSN 637]
MALFMAFPHFASHLLLSSFLIIAFFPHAIISEPYEAFCGFYGAKPRLTSSERGAALLAFGVQRGSPCTGFAVMEERSVRQDYGCVLQSIPSSILNVRAKGGSGDVITSAFNIQGTLVQFRAKGSYDDLHWERVCC